jgi:hypothetical protein
MEQVLRQFVENEVMKNTVKAYMISVLEKRIVSEAYAGKDVKAVAEAKKVIDKTFSEIESMFHDTKKIHKDPR